VVSASNPGYYINQEAAFQLFLRRRGKILGNATAKGSDKAEKSPARQW
jgi:hypothetical protein